MAIACSAAGASTRWPDVPPPVLLSLMLVLLSAFAFHALFGRSGRGIATLVVVALAGFLAGEALARAFDTSRGTIGTVHVAFGLAGAWAFLFVARRWAA